MTSWALLLLASALLATPGLTFSGLNPEGNELMTADLCQEEQFLESLVLEALQGARLNFTCKPCKVIIEGLRKVLAKDTTEEAVKQVASLLCKPVPVVHTVCENIITKLFSKMKQIIMNGKSPQEICVKLRMCKPEIGL